MTQQIPEGATVYDAAGAKLGKVRAYDAQGGYLDVEKGWLFPKDFYVPLSLVTRTDADGVYLSVAQDNLQSGQYDTIPAAGTGTMADTRTVQGTAAPQQTTPAPQAGTVTTSTTATGTDEVVVPEYEEQLVAGTREDEIGRVHVHKDVVTEQESIPVTLEREQVTVERVPVSGPADAGAVQGAFQEQDIDVPVLGEEAVVGKQVRETEEVRLHKEAVTEQQQVSDTVRKERVVVDPPNREVDSLPNPTTIDPRR